MNQEKEKRLAQRKLPWQNVALGMIGVYGLMKTALRLVLVVKTIQIQKEILKSVQGGDSEAPDNIFDIYHKY